MEQTEFEKYIHDQFQKDMEEIKKHIAVLNDEMGAVQLAVEKMKGKMGIYALVTPIFTGLLGVLATYIITRNS